MRDHPISEAPNYTTPALVMGFVNLFCAFLVIWAVWGFEYALILAFIVMKLIDRIPTRD